jgi:hypothetical protein
MRLIDADARIDDLQNELKAGYMGSEKADYFEKLIQDYKDQPVIDAQPVIHGHWEPFEKEAYWFQDIEKIWETGKPTKSIQYRCSHCLTEFGTIVVEGNYMYCPKCGAKMDEEKE